MMTALKSKDDNCDFGLDINVQFHLIFVSVELSGLVLELHGIIELLSLFSTDNYPALIREQFWVITERSGGSHYQSSELRKHSWYSGSCSRNMGSAFAEVRRQYPFVKYQTRPWTKARWCSIVDTLIMEVDEN